MSKQAVLAFLGEVARDPDLQKEMAALAAKHGYDFSADELNESDLAGIAGGSMGSLEDLERQVVFKKKPAKK